MTRSLKITTRWKDEIFGAAVILMFRLQRETRKRQLGEQVVISWITVHRIFAIALLIAEKVTGGDGRYFNCNYAKICGLSPTGLQCSILYCILCIRSCILFQPFQFLEILHIVSHFAHLHPSLSPWTVVDSCFNRVNLYQIIITLN